MDKKITIRAFYKFVSLENFGAIKPALLAACLENELKGTILLAHEGINGTVSGPIKGIVALFEYLHNIPAFSDLPFKESYCADYPFTKMKVHLKNEIVTIGIPSVDPTKKVGQYVKPKDWNALIEDPEVLLIDTRNEYELAVGTFKNSLNPHTNSFRDFPQYVKENLDPKKHKKIAMCCTGGIRCEKSTSFMLDQGFEEVYHLDGGILQYLEDIPKEDSLWKGDCFIFDHRVSLEHDLSEGDFEMCFACRQPLSKEDMQSEKYAVGISCSYCLDSQTEDKRDRMLQRQMQSNKQTTARLIE